MPATSRARARAGRRAAAPTRSRPGHRCRCAPTADSDHQLIIAPKSTEWVSSGEARSVSRAISIFGVTLGSQSGWSKHVKTEWENVGTVPRAICSVYGEPNTAPVTYVGGVIRD